MATDLMIGETERPGVSGTSVLRLRSDGDRGRSIAWLHVHRNPIGLTRDQARQLATALRRWAGKR